MTASQALKSAWASLVSQFGGLSLAEVVLNAVLTFGVVLVGFLAVWAGRHALAGVGRRLPGAPGAEKKVHVRRLAPVLLAALRVVALGATIIAVAKIWGLQPLAGIRAWLGEGVTDALARLAILLVVTVAAFEISAYVVGQALHGMAARATSRRRRAQLETLGPLLQGVLHVAILIVAAMMALGEIGVEIGPLLAGAGVVGIAIGFGAQTLVKDFLTGVFLIVEDIVSVGDIIRVGDSGGTVEAMTLRTIRLRDFDGTLHVFPYGEAQVVHNLTKTFSYCVFELQVSYDSNLDEALDLMRTVGEQLQSEEAFRDKILEPIEVVGVDSLAESGVVLKGRIKTRPLEQWTVGRAYNRRIKLAFDDAGIQIPYPHMQVVLPDRQVKPLVRH